jgi:LPXTG-motif cell wall-anchored protein
VSELPPPYHLLANTPGNDPLPQAEAVVITPGAKLVILGTLRPLLLARLKQELNQQHLAHTGGNDSGVLGAGVVALLVGSMLVLATRRRGTRDV